MLQDCARSFLILLYWASIWLARWCALSDALHNASDWWMTDLITIWEWWLSHKTYVARARTALGWQAGRIVATCRILGWLRRAALSRSYVIDQWTYWLRARHDRLNWVEEGLTEEKWLVMQKCEDEERCEPWGTSARVVARCRAKGRWVNEI